MKAVRILSPYVPYPADEGAFHLILNQTLYLASIFDQVEVLSWKNTPEEFQKKTDAIRKRFGLANVKWINLHSHVEHRSRGSRLLQAVFSEYASPELHYYPELVSVPELRDVDLEIFHYSFCVPWLEKWPMEAKKRVCVLHNIESDIFRAKLKAETNPLAKLYHRKTLRKLLAHERTLATRFDELWCLSHIDATDFAKANGASQIRVIPPNYDGWMNLKPTFVPQKQITVGFVGGMDFGPNHDSVQFLLEKIAPLLPNDSQAFKMILGGKNPPRFVLDSPASFRFVEVPGFIHDIDDFWNQLDAFLIPHITGSGVRTKLLEALARRIPTLTNQAGASRIDSALKDLPYLHVSDDPTEWAQLITSGQLRQERRDSLTLPFPEKLKGAWTLRDL